MLNGYLTGMDIEYLERRTEEAIKEFGLENLMEYTLDSPEGCDLEYFYKTVVEQVLIEDIYISAAEISDGKYEVTFEFGGKDIWYICSYAWDTVEIILENLMDNVIMPHIKRSKMTCQNLCIA